MLGDVGMCQFTSTSNSLRLDRAMTVLSAPPPVTSGDDVVKRRHGVHDCRCSTGSAPKNVIRAHARTSERSAVIT